MRANAAFKRRLVAVLDKLAVSDESHRRKDETIHDLREQIRSLESTVAILDDELELTGKRWIREIERQKAETALHTRVRMAGQRVIDEE